MLRILDRLGMNLKCLFSGELLTVAPWAARTMPGLFALNERAVLSGYWEHGFFSYTAVGAYNVGSIRLTVDKVESQRQVCKLILLPVILISSCINSHN